MRANAAARVDMREYRLKLLCCAVFIVPFGSCPLGGGEQCDLHADAANEHQHGQTRILVPCIRALIIFAMDGYMCVCVDLMTQ